MRNVEKEKQKNLESGKWADEKTYYPKLLLKRENNPMCLWILKKNQFPPAYPYSSLLSFSKRNSTTKKEQLLTYRQKHSPPVCHRVLYLSRILRYNEGERSASWNQKSKQNLMRYWTLPLVPGRGHIPATSSHFIGRKRRFGPIETRAFPLCIIPNSQRTSRRLGLVFTHQIFIIMQFHAIALLTDADGTLVCP